MAAFWRTLTSHTCITIDVKHVFYVYNLVTFFTFFNVFTARCYASAVLTIGSDAENARPENDGQKTMGLENARVENDGQKLRGLENAGLENDGQTFSNL